MDRKWKGIILYYTTNDDQNYFKDLTNKRLLYQNITNRITAIIIYILIIRRITAEFITN